MCHAGHDHFRRRMPGGDPRSYRLDYVKLPFLRGAPGIFRLPGNPRKSGAILKQMTLAEKLGQLTQFSNGAATGPDNVKIDEGELAARGGLGSLLNLSARGVQRAPEAGRGTKSRLKIPHAFRPGRDPRPPHGVSHTPRLSAAWDTDLAQRFAVWPPWKQPPTVFAGLFRRWSISPATPAGEGSRRAVVKTLTWDP